MSEQPMEYRDVEINGQGVHRAVNMADAINPQDYTTKQQTEQIALRNIQPHIVAVDEVVVILSNEEWLVADEHMVDGEIHNDGIVYSV